MRQITLTALADFPLVAPGMDLADLIGNALERQGLQLQNGDVLVLAQKIVSKAENRFVDLNTITPSPEAIELAEKAEKDPRLVHVILTESRRVVRVRRDLIIVEHRLGFVMANAGVDQSNIGMSDNMVLLLPSDSDASAERLRHKLGDRFDAGCGVVINDSFGRAWRKGVCGVAIGAAGLPCIIDKRGDIDLFGRELKVTVVGFADEIAAAASLLMGQADEGCPVVLVRGLSWTAPDGSVSDLLRAPEEDLFR